MAASPLKPAGGVAGWVRGPTAVASSCLTSWTVIGIGPGYRGGDADGQGGHDTHEVAADRGVEPRLALIQAEVILRARSSIERPARRFSPVR